MKGFGSHKKSKNKNTKNLRKDNLKEQIIYKAFKFHSEGNISEAIKFYQSFIKQGFKDFKLFSNYGFILISLGKLKEAELLYRKAIELKPSYAEAHSNLGNVLRDLNKLKEAELLYRKAIELKPNFAKAHYNLGIILRDLNKLKEAELSYRKAIELEPNYAEAHSNLGNVLRDLNKLKEAELCFIKAIELKPNFAKAYHSLSNLKYSNDNIIWKGQLFSEKILINQSKKNQIDIYFARANILHNEKKFDESSRYFKLANKLKLILKPSNAETLINQSKVLLIESDKKSNETLNFAVRYWEKIKGLKKKTKLVTNKNLYNYQFAGIIAKKIPNAKIFHCYRHPLDNILSIYRAHFARGNEYSSSLVDCARVYQNQEKVMKEYKKRFRSKIYDVNYDLLVSNPHEEIKSLISWLGWKWEDKYLSPHLNPRSVSTASSVQVRSPINSKSLGGWKNYIDMLKPAIEIINQDNKFKNLTH